MIYLMIVGVASLLHFAGVSPLGGFFILLWLFAGVLCRDSGPSGGYAHEETKREPWFWRTVAALFIGLPVTLGLFGLTVYIVVALMGSGWGALGAVSAVTGFWLALLWYAERHRRMCAGPRETEDRKPA